MKKKNIYYPIKRMIDIVLSACGLTVLSPLIFVVALTIRLMMGKPVIFRQMRPGKGGKPFQLLKFRTMRPHKYGVESQQSDEDRITELGKILRQTSIDELPTLINVLMGDMSLVGPRPLLMHYLKRYTQEQSRRHEVKPGITGWAQVNGRNAITWEEKFKLDVWYVDHQSFLLDMKILALTVIKVIKKEGISAAGYATMPEFMGSMQENTKKQ